MRGLARGLAALAVAGGFAWLAACGSSTPPGPLNVSLKGNYTLTTFTLAGQAQPFTSGALALTDSEYAVDIVFPQGTLPEIVDSGTYTATDSGGFSETSRLNGLQISGTYTMVNNLLTVSATEQGVPVTQGWQKQ